VQKFDGFLKLYQEGRDEKTEEDDEAERSLPRVTKGETLDLKKIAPEQHFTEPPPRFTEATLVKALEEKGIGRPSTMRLSCRRFRIANMWKSARAAFIPQRWA